MSTSSIKLTAPKGTHDILPEEVVHWQAIEHLAHQVFQCAGYQEIRTPIFEATALFERGVGETTDVVNKEMYSFEKEERSLTLRPENTAGVVRAYIEHGMSRWPKPVKLYYMGPMFRYERPQKGRQRQFHQLGMECFGSESPYADLEVILLAMDFFTQLGLTGLSLKINNVGTLACRQRFKTNFQNVLAPFLNQLCEDCQRRYHVNTLRLLDCKVEACQAIYNGPEIAQFLDQDFTSVECQQHFQTVLKGLQHHHIPFEVNRMLVRGLDYYTITVFEICSDQLGSQNTVCGGGRYNNLLETLGGPPTPAVGWALGMERLLSLAPKNTQQKKLFAIIAEDPLLGTTWARQLRQSGFAVIHELTAQRGFGKQFAQADKLGAQYALVFGETELANHTVILKDLVSGTQDNFDQSQLIDKLTRLG